MEESIASVAKKLRFVNTSPFDNIELCVVCEGVDYDPSEDPEDTAADLLQSLRFDENVTRLQLVAATHLGDVNNVERPLLEIAFSRKMKTLIFLFPSQFLLISFFVLSLVVNTKMVHRFLLSISKLLFRIFSIVII